MVDNLWLWFFIFFNYLYNLFVIPDEETCRGQMFGGGFCENWRNDQKKYLWFGKMFFFFFQRHVVYCLMVYCRFQLKTTTFCPKTFIKHREVSSKNAHIQQVSLGLIWYWRHHITIISHLTLLRGIEFDFSHFQIIYKKKKVWDWFFIR